MAAPKFTQEQYETLLKATFEGVLIVEYADKKVQYRSTDDMLKLLGIMEDYLGIKSNDILNTYGAFNRGL